MPDHSETRMKVGLWTYLERLSTVAVLVTVVVVGWAYFKPKATAPGTRIPTEPISIDGASIMGKPDAPLVLVIYSDFQCPFCAKFATETWPILQEKYVKTGQVMAAFRHLALPNHQFAAGAAAAAECAGEQTKFWEMHDLLFKDQSRLRPEQLVAAATSLGLDGASFERCLSRGSEKTANDRQAAVALGIRATPTFFVGRLLPGGKMKVIAILSGARPVEEFGSAFTKARGSN